MIAPISPNTTTNPYCAGRRSSSMDLNQDTSRDQLITVFLERLGIESLPVRVIKKSLQANGSYKKKFIPLNYDLGLKSGIRIGFNLFRTDMETVKEIQRVYACKRAQLEYRYGNELMGAMDTNVYMVMDIDDAEAVNHPFVQDLMKRTPYYLSVSKGFPKLWVQVSGTAAVNNLPVWKEDGDVSPRVELQQGQWSYYEYNQVVYNAELPVVRLTVEDLKTAFPSFLQPRMARELEIVTRRTRQQVGANEELECIAPHCPKDAASYSDIDRLVNLLKKERADEFLKWLKIGYIIKYHLGLEGWPIFKTFSKRSPKFEEVEVERKYREILPSGQVNYETLKMYVYHDDPKAYISIFLDVEEDRDRVLEYYVGAVKENFTSRDLAIMYSLTDEAKRFKFDGERKNQKWFWMSDEGIWKNQQTHLKTSVAEVLKNLLDGTYGSSEKQKKLENAHTMLLGNGTKLQDIITSFLDSRLAHDNFYDCLDSKPNLLAFNDCVFDIEVCDYRPILPEDYISTTVGYNRPTPDPAIQAELKQFMYHLFEDEEKESYLMKALASCLFEGNRFQKVHILTGRGSNGKSLLLSLMNTTLGKYIEAVHPTSLTCGRKEQNKPTEWAATRAKRFVHSVEPDRNQYIQPSILKSISGGDVMKERAMYQNMEAFRPQFVYYLISNDIPKISEIDFSVLRRLSLIRFPFTFKTNPNPDEPTERLMDVGLEKKFKMDERYGQNFLLMLMDTYIREIKDTDSLGDVPADFEASKQEYIKECNQVQYFIDLKYELLPCTEENKRDQKNVFDREKLYTHYTYSHARLGLTNLSQKAFNDLLNKVETIELSKFVVREPGYHRDNFTMRKKAGAHEDDDYHHNAFMNATDRMGNMDLNESHPLGGLAPGFNP